MIAIPIQRLLRQTRCHLVMHCSTSLHDTSHLSPRLSLVIASAVGSLDDLEAEIDKWDVVVSPSLVTQVIDSCTATFDSKNSIASRKLCRFFSWCQRQNAELGDEVFNHAIQAFAKMRDLTSMSLTISDLRKQSRIMTPETFSLVVETLVKLDKEEEAIQLFRRLDNKDQLIQYCHGNERGCSSGLITLVHSLCAKGHAAKARGTVWKHMRELLTSEGPATSIIHRSILHGWCIHGNVKEARRVMAEMKSMGIRPGLASYNDLLLCICKRNVKFNPSGLVPEAINLMIEMRSCGVPPTTTSFNILLSCLSKVRRVKEAYRILYSMRKGEAGCSPDWISFYIVVKVLYLTARFTRGNRLVDEMIMGGLLPSQSFYHNLIGMLCGLEKVDLALMMLGKMNEYSEQSSGKTYDLLIDKLGRSGQFDKAKCLWNEAIKKGIILQCSRDLLDPSKMVVFKPTTSGSRKVQRTTRR